MALDWVREHIGDFGGDTDKITVFGQSAGAAHLIVHGSYVTSAGLMLGLSALAIKDVAVMSGTMRDHGVPSSKNPQSSISFRIFLRVQPVIPGCRMKSKHSDMCGSRHMLPSHSYGDTETAVTAFAREFDPGPSLGFWDARDFTNTSATVKKSMIWQSMQMEDATLRIL
ncbi:hypothetical protein K504DRAFT_506048 [Pleomassaria siparia CBS 279.74]|uniref:Carboxylic ester hydrolase n=1 Tax=Pleomassaria siparia CBS 279.74 TaxID=1314801 RepID=A0A6G1JYG1_9PLEO|nr:hypothetical protein K504DRAFT_506048 [Pleomassaria siparia CBS 279.74]